MCNTRKQEQSRKTAISFPFDGRLGLVFLLAQKSKELCHENQIYLIWPSYKITQKNKKVSRAWTVQWYGFRFCRRISFIAFDTYRADRTQSLAFTFFLVSIEFHLAHVGFLSTLQQNFPSLLVCNAWKWEQSRKTDINFSSDGRLGLVFLCWNENDKNYVMGGTFSWFDLPIKLHKNKEVSRARTVQWYGFRLCRRISLIASDTYGAEATWSLAFSYCLVSKEHDLCHRCFLSAFQQNFPGLLVCNARKREHSRKTAINFPSDGRLGLVFFCWNDNDKNYGVGGKFSWFDLPIKFHK